MSNIVNLNDWKADRWTDELEDFVDYVSEMAEEARLLRISPQRFVIEMWWATKEWREREEGEESNGSGSEAS